MPWVVSRLVANKVVLVLLTLEFMLLWVVASSSYRLPVSYEQVPPTRAVIIVASVVASSLTPLLAPVDGSAEHLSSRPIELWVLGLCSSLTFVLGACSALVLHGRAEDSLIRLVVTDLVGLIGVVALGVAWMGVWAAIAPWGVLMAALVLGPEVVPGRDVGYANWAWLMSSKPASLQIAVALWVIGVGTLSWRTRMVRA